MGNGYEYKIQYLKRIPIVMVTDKNKNSIDEIEIYVDKILSLKSKNFHYDTKVLEHEIDLLIYQIYELTPEEIEIIEKL